MKIIGEGQKNGQKQTVTFDLLDTYDTEKDVTSMARTTGYTATAAANMILDGLFTEKGVFPPELVGQHPTCFDYILNYLAERGVIYMKK
jgi:lysine 6-dehydrogenase